MGMKISDQVQMREVLKEGQDLAEGVILGLDPGSVALGFLNRDRVLHDETSVPAISKEQAVAFLLVDLDGRNQEGPEDVFGEIGLHRRIQGSGVRGSRKPNNRKYSFINKFFTAQSALFPAITLTLSRK
jgi:hypothetical protein